METEEERKGRLGNDAATKRLRLVMESGKMVATTQLRLALEAEDERSPKNGMDWIGFEFNLENVLSRPVMGTIFLVSQSYCILS